MNNSNNNHLNILDCPDEILFIIFEKLNMVDVFHSLVDVNRRFNRLVIDPLYTRDLDMTDMMTINSLCNQTSSVNIEVLSRICERILCKIHHQVHKLTVEEYSMKQILRAANYPELYSLSLLNCEEKILYRYLRDDLILRNLLTKQITHLNITIKKTRESSSKTSKIFASILSLCEKLIVLNISDTFPTLMCSDTSFRLRWKSYTPSTLIKLKINVATLTDCLILLDGPLICLSTLIINVSDFFHPFGYIDPTKKLPKLKCFSLTSFNRTSQYDTLIVPLLCRMINLEELKLYLTVTRYDLTFIDGIQFYDQSLIYMTQLHKFTFDIKTEVYNKYRSVELQLNEDIQRSFIGRCYQQVASYVNTNSCVWGSRCHIYSLPYDFEYFYDLDNSFQGGMFDKVRELTD